MTSNELKDLFGTTKPIIAMCHLKPMPGDPSYDEKSGMSAVVEQAKKDLTALQEGGVDAVMFSNEFSLPYLTEVRPETTAAMGRVVGELLESITVPFGVDVLWDPIATLDLAAATGAQFVREIVSGVYASDFGLWNTNPGRTARHRRELGIENVKIFYNIVPEAAVYLGNRKIEEIAKSTVFNHRPDALCVSGITAGAEIDSEVLIRVKEATPEISVFSNTGCKVDNITIQLKHADGAIVGTTFKVDGQFNNAVDGKRVKQFMERVWQSR